MENIPPNIQARRINWGTGSIFEISDGTLNIPTPKETAIEIAIESHRLNTLLREDLIRSFINDAC